MTIRTLLEQIQGALDTGEVTLDSPVRYGQKGRYFCTFGRLVIDQEEDYDENGNCVKGQKILLIPNDNW